MTKKRSREDDDESNLKQLPSELMEEILSRLGLKENIHASLVCKTWFETAVSVRRKSRRPWLFYPLDESDRPLWLKGIQDEDDDPTEIYNLVDPTSWSTYRQISLPGLKGHRFTCSRDGWLLVSMDDRPWKLIFFLNPFTQERIYLPPISSPGADHCLVFSAAPTTTTTCLVLSIVEINKKLAIMTWRPGETLWTSHYFDNHSPNGQWNRCVFSNSMFYCLNTCGHLGVFDPSKASWTILSLYPCPAFLLPETGRRVLMMEHEGDIFVLSTCSGEDPCLYKLNLETMFWEDKTKLGGLTVFASEPTSLTRAGLSEIDRNRIYPSHLGDLRVFYHHGGDNLMIHRYPTSNYLSNRIAWVDPPHNF